LKKVVDIFKKKRISPSSTQRCETTTKENTMKTLYYLNYTALLMKHADEGWSARIAKTQKNGVWFDYVPMEDADPANGNFDGQIKPKYRYSDNLLLQEIVAPPCAPLAKAEKAVRCIIDRLESPAGIAEAAVQNAAIAKEKSRLERAVAAYAAMSPEESLEYVNAHRNGPSLSKDFAGTPHVRRQFLALYQS
jgi:hypothetical protein